MFSPLSTSCRDAPVIRRVTRGRAEVFGAPLRVLVAHQPDEVLGVLAEVEREAAAGRIAAGFVAYDAAPAFDSALVAHRDPTLPLAWFAIYKSGESWNAPAVPAPGPALDWRADLSAPAYRGALDRIRAWITAGDTYQVNFTFPMRARIDGDGCALFDALAAAQPTDFGWLIDTGEVAVLSVSPELFFRLDGDRVTCKPMKGTAPRGLSCDDDDRNARMLRASEKERAENVMIVDMVRNDLGRIAETGSVRVTSLFDAERLDTCWQMTSTVEARTHASLPDIFRALFPSASVTGAPKVRTMQIIRDLESGPRGVYCGAIGWVGPGRRAEFSVGIRTVTIDRESGEAVYHVGSGITWDSAANAEFEECRLKAAVLTHRRPEFDLLESLRWEDGYWLLEGHLDRVRASAAYFDFTFDEAAVREELLRFARGLDAAAKVRLTVSRRGRIAIDAVPLGDPAIWQVAVSPEPVDIADVFLYHKTTLRTLYNHAQALCPGADDVLLWNERRELTESTRANVALRMGEDWFTPPVSSGLLGGVYRARLLRDGALQERILTLDDLETADEVRLINSVRGWIAVERMHQPLAGRA
jgi:para-aminobenzoate synthetase/4-amino-4-deoxychorismate lyase